MIVTLADGEAREARAWPDGSWTCPFCSSANLPGDRRAWTGPCSNPACVAGGRGSAEQIAEWRRTVAARTAAAAAAATGAAADTSRAAQAEVARLARCAEATLASRAEGWCYRCWAKSTSYGRWSNREIRIRHRKPGNCPQLRRRGTRS